MSNNFGVAFEMVVEMAEVPLRSSIGSLSGITIVDGSRVPIKFLMIVIVLLPRVSHSVRVHL